MPEDFDLQSVWAANGSARGLPNRHYTSPEVHRAEMSALLCSNWAALGFASDVAESEAVPAEFAGLPLLLMRSRDGVLRVFQNVCRHRGMILVSEKRQVGGVLRCPYHSWCYAQNGDLVATPHVGGAGQNTHPAIDRNELRLIEVRSHVWRDVIFVNIDGNAPDFEVYASAAKSRWSAFEGRALLRGENSYFTIEVACNWKLAVENYCESYHLPWVHPGLNSYSRLEDHYNIEESGSFSGQGTCVYTPMTGRTGRRFPSYEGLPSKWMQGAEYIALYPNVLLGVHCDHAFAIILEPLDTERTIEHVALYYGSEEAALGDRFAEMRRRNLERWREVFEEDISVVEGMQKGRAAPGFDGGRFSPVMDSPTLCFHRWAAEQFAKNRVRPAP